MSRLTPRGHTDTDRDLLVAPLRFRKHLHLVDTDKRQSVGCSSACADGAPCDCSHAVSAWTGPRVPRRPGRPTHPRLNLWRRIVLAWQSWRAGWSSTN